MPQWHSKWNSSKKVLLETLLIGRETVSRQAHFMASVMAMSVLSL
jgi:hypothetical protein